MANLPAFHVMAKPTGATCNLKCDYCFFLKKDKLYPDNRPQMSEEVMERYIRQTIQGHRTQQATIAWQGGEPTMMGLDFFRKVVEVEKRLNKPGLTIENTIQTNGVLIDDQWCEFFHENRFLVGLSLDGPQRFHDAYRRNKAGQSVFDRVVRAVRLMQKHDVEFNILCTVNAKNSLSPLEVYRFFRDEIGARYLQTIPIVERDNDSGFQQGTAITDRSVNPEQYGRFLIEIFDEWLRHDVGTMFIQFFDGVLASYVNGCSSLCILQPTCGESVALEHNGDLYSCDHYVEPDFLLGNISHTSISDLVSSEKQRAFGLVKSESLPEYCKACEFLFTCYGECPKNRVLKTPDGQPGLNWLCTGLKNFFAHTQGAMLKMEDKLRRGEPAASVMERKKRIGRNSPCPCGSGKKYKKCHGRA